MFADKIWFGAIPEIHLKHGSHRLAEENCSELQISKSKMEKITIHHQNGPQSQWKEFDVNKQKVSLPHKVSNQQKLGSKPAYKCTALLH